ncbi:Iron-sulfur flavoprotein [bioreactor metagenome]|uniref:Iron-sulfur flavoprotein n=1 Tax=bioreactor metagenome TaxID=1076179 RepID=A0A645ETS2_9ZZZZ
MVKRVIAINSSRRKKNTYGILEQLQEELKKEKVEVEIINLFDYDIKECYGCEQCLRVGKCHIKDDMDLLMDKLKECDGIIISTPVYMSSLSGKLKVFIDRTCRWFHRPELVGIPALVVSTTAASGLKGTFKILDKLLIQWAAFPTGAIGRTANTIKNPVDQKEYKNFVNHLFMKKEDYKLTLNQLIMFQVQKVLATKILELDKEYWEEKHWVDNNYFYNCNISQVKKGISKSFYKMLNKKVKKVGE